MKKALAFMSVVSSPLLLSSTTVVPKLGALLFVLTMADFQPVGQALYTVFTIFLTNVVALTAGFLALPL
jgi:hypothetical protein